MEIINIRETKVNANHVHIEFKEPREVLSSAVLNGGFATVKHILNMRVDKEQEKRLLIEPPEEILASYAEDNFGSGECVGLMTAADMDTYSHCLLKHDDVIVECHVTVGLSNARKAGDKADVQTFEEVKTEVGTINMIIGTNADLTHSAMVEVMMLATESKAALLSEFNIKSFVSGESATGTGTDSIVIYNGKGRKIKYSGKHVLFGEMAGKSVIKSLRESLVKYLSQEE